jgi:hypothetical protein
MPNLSYEIIAEEDLVVCHATIISKHTIPGYMSTFECPHAKKPPYRNSKETSLLNGLATGSKMRG